MNLLIVEDEDLAVKKLINTLLAIDPLLCIAGVTDSIKATVRWLESNPAPDLILMDIELADGRSFEIFNLIDVKSPVIFVTSYDEYALKAFKVNSVDYLLKPIQKADLSLALEKFKKLHQDNKREINIENLVNELHQRLRPKEFRQRFLVKHVQKLVSIETNDIAYFYSEGRINFFKTFDNKRYMVDYLMDELEEMLDPSRFFRINRSLFVSLASISKIEEYFGFRLILRLNPPNEKEAIVSREKVMDFKKWMGK
jgi:DNA-binding LytR/AlgR family response regulator